MKFNLFQLAGVFALTTFISCSTDNTKADYVAQYMVGKSATDNLRHLYITPGDRAYCVSIQDGTFPDLNGHESMEMGGIWANPFKLADGFSLRVNGTLLAKADKYTTFPYGNSFDYDSAIDGLKIERFQFIPQDKPSMIVEYNIQNLSAEEKALELMFSVRFDLHPSWFHEEAGIVDGSDELMVDSKAGTLSVRDRNNGWAAVCLSDQDAVASTDAPAELDTHGKGNTGSLLCSVSVPAGKTVKLTYCIAGSLDKGIEAATATASNVIANSEKYLAEKKALYEDVISRARITIPNKAVQDAYTYAKINDEWLVCKLPGMRFLGAGAKEYPWLFACDNSYAQQGIVATGDFKLTEDTFNALDMISFKCNGNGRIMHEMAPFGCVFNYGNTQETAHFIVAVYDAFKWTGNVEWLKVLYPNMKKGLDWLFGEMDKNGDLFPEGYGIMEVRGLDAELIDCAVYSQQALLCMSEMAVLFGEKENATKWKGMSDQLLEKINTLFWDDKSHSYCDFFGDSEDAARVARDAAKQYPDGKDVYYAMAAEFESLPKGTEKGFLTNGNWVISCPMEMGIAPADRAAVALDKVRNEHCGTYGPFLSSTDRDEAMTISTGVQAVAEARYGRVDNAMEYLDMIASTLDAHLPGSICEMMPNYGCPAQAWTIYGPAKTLICYVFGIKPDAASKAVTIKPCIPSEWESFSIEDVRVGDATFSLFFSTVNGKLTCDIKTDRPEFTYMVTLPGGDEQILTGSTRYRI